MMRRSPVIAAIGLLAGFLLAGCTAENLETDNQPQPGPTGHMVSPVSEPVSGTYTGTQTIELGKPPEGATHIRTQLTCLSPGTLTLDDGSVVICPTGSAATTAMSSSELLPAQHSITLTSNEPDTKYELIVVYEDGASIR